MERVQLFAIGGRTWWVPESHSTALAVPISTEREYPRAIEDKLARLVKAIGVARALELMDGVGLETVEPTTSVERVVQQLLGSMDVGSMVREGSPRLAAPAAREDAEAAVEAQAELRLEDFLA